MWREAHGLYTKTPGKERKEEMRKGVRGEKDD